MPLITIPPWKTGCCNNSLGAQLNVPPVAPFTLKPLLVSMPPLTCRVAPDDEGNKPMPTFEFEVSTVNRFRLPDEFCTLSAVVEDALKVLLPVKVCELLSL